MRERLTREARKEQLMSAALTQAVKLGYQRVTLCAVAEAAGVATSLVTYYFNTMTQLRRAIMRTAVKREILEIIAQGLANGDANASAAPEAIKRRALNTLMN